MIRQSPEDGSPEHREVLDWMIKRVPYQEYNPNLTVVCWRKDGEIKAAYGLSHHSRICDTVDLVCAVEGTLMIKDMLITMLDHIFNQLECQRANIIVAETNTLSHKATKMLGAKLEGVCRRGYGGEDAYVYGLLLEDAIPLWDRLQKERT